MRGNAVDWIFAQPLTERDVRVEGIIGERIKATIEGNVFKLNIDEDFILPFRQRKSRQGEYIGIGLLLETLSRLAAYTGDERVAKLKEEVLDKVLDTEHDSGYIGTFREEDRVWTVWDMQETSYIIYGLVVHHDLFNDQRSLDAAERLAEYIMKELWADARDGWKKMDDLQLNEKIGIEMAICELYRTTKKQKYLDFCLNCIGMLEWNDPVELGRKNRSFNPDFRNIGHNYAYLCRCFAQLRLFHLVKDPNLLRTSHRVMEFLTKGNGLVITGCSGYQENWHNTQLGTLMLAETCATTYMIRVFDELFRIHGDSIYGDIMERTIYNALFAAQSPDGKRIRYFMPFAGERTYWDVDTFCCPNSYRKIISEIPTMVYFKTKDGVVINLYSGSSASIDLRDDVKIKLYQETNYPHSDAVKVHIDPSQPAEFSLTLRIPRWCKKAKVTVNDEVIQRNIEPGMYTINRHWRSGDTIVLHLPMELRMVRGTAAQSGRVAIMYGPLVFCLSRKNINAQGIENTGKPKYSFGITMARKKESVGDKHISDYDLHNIHIHPNTLEGPFPASSGKGYECKLKGWRPGVWYHIPPELELTLTEYTDPEGEVVYFLVPYPDPELFVNDELMS